MKTILTQNIKELQDFEIDCVDEYGRTAVHAAARSGQVEALQASVELFH